MTKLNKKSIVHEVVNDLFVKNVMMFTSVDVNKIITQPHYNKSIPHLKNREVSTILNEMVNDNTLGSLNYKVTKITLVNVFDQSELEVNVYHDTNMSPFDYKTLNFVVKQPNPTLTIKTKIKHTILDVKNNVIVKTKKTKIDTSNMSLEDIKQYIESNFENFNFPN